MPKDHDTQKKVQEIWEKTKIALKKLGHETAEIAKKGEEQVIKATKAGKLQVDIIGQKTKKDKLFRQIGQKSFDLYRSGKSSENVLAPLCKEVEKIEGRISKMKENISTIYSKKNASGKKAKKSKKPGS